MKKLTNNDTLKLQKIENLLSALITIIQQKSESRPNLSILTQRELLQQLSIAPNTLKSWEQNGLKRLEPPIEGTRSVYYHLDDVLNFLTH